MSNYKIALSPTVSWTSIEGQTVLFSKKTGDFFGINETGAHLIQELLKSDFDATVAASAKAFEVPADQISADLSELVESLLGAQLVTRTMT